MKTEIATRYPSNPSAEVGGSSGESPIHNPTIHGSVASNGWQWGNRVRGGQSKIFLVVNSLSMRFAKSEQ